MLNSTCKMLYRTDSRLFVVWVALPSISFLGAIIVIWIYPYPISLGH